MQLQKNLEKFKLAFFEGSTDIICSVTETITVIESNEAVFNTIEILDWSPNTNSIQVFVEGIGNYEYSINGIDYQDSPIFTNLEAG